MTTSRTSRARPWATSLRGTGTALRRLSSLYLVCVFSLREGYDVAKKYASKFNLIAPTWYRWEASASGKIRLTGQKDVDLEWAKAVKEAGKAHDLKITPRFVIEFDGEAVFGQGQDPRKQVLTMVALAVTECKKQNWDGLVFEASYIVKEMLGAIQVFSDQLHKEGKLLIITAS